MLRAAVLLLAAACVASLTPSPTQPALQLPPQPECPAAVEGMAKEAGMLQVRLRPVALRRPAATAAAAACTGLLPS